ncbi:MAG TPA: alpha/beta hydrolase [Candidatus Limnocylindrales bacterium]|nr:alpha/beta hydrolase [Candidatus Limnocylindrales bacterium]
MTSFRKASLIAAVAALPMAAAYRFALVYRGRAGYPRRVEADVDPGAVGLAFEATVVRSAGVDLPAWFMPAGRGRRGPGVVLVHGWESAHHRTLPIAQFLQAAGFHTLAFDVRGHGANPPEQAPITGGEFGADAAAAIRALVDRPEVDRVGVVGHSMGGVGALIAAAAEPAVGAVVSISAPADPYRLTRLTFRLAELPIPDPIAYPLAWLTARVYAKPRGHRIEDISASRAIARIAAPILLVHGAVDTVIPPDHLKRLAGHAPVGTKTYLVEGGGHSWLYEDAGFRRTVAAFLAASLGGRLTPEQAAERAAAVDARRMVEAVDRRDFSAVEEAPRPSLLAAEIAGLRRRVARR